MQLIKYPSMNKLRKATIKDLKNSVPEEDLKYIEQIDPSERFILSKSTPYKKQDDSLVELEIAFRKCKRVGVFD